MSYSIKGSTSGAVAKQHKSRIEKTEELRKHRLPMTVLSCEVFGSPDAIYGTSYYDDVMLLTEDETSQYELQLENPKEVLDHHKRMIRRYEAGYERMAEFALKWYYLISDAEEDEVIAKLLRDIQLLRKLCGYTVL